MTDATIDIGATRNFISERMATQLSTPDNERADRLPVRYRSGKTRLHMQNRLKETAPTAKTLRRETDDAVSQASNNIAASLHNR